MQAELKGIADILDFCPSQVATKLFTAKEGGPVSTPDEVVENAFRDLGHETWIHGCKTHSINYQIMHLLPDSVFDKVCRDMVSDHKKRSSDNFKRV